MLASKNNEYAIHYCFATSFSIVIVNLVIVIPIIIIFTDAQLCMNGGSSSEPIIVTWGIWIGLQSRDFYHFVIWKHLYHD